jgi:methionine-rich copper-binding protein CopC
VATLGLTSWKLTRYGGGRSLAAALLFLFLQQSAWGRPLQVVESQPAANSVVGRHPAQYFIRFEGPVDHYRSRLAVTRGGEVVQILHPRLDAAPELLFGTAPALEPGEYELRWTVTSLTGGDVTEGSVPFAVRPGPG